MTAQISSKVLIDKDVYSLVGVRGTGLFDPLKLGLEPVPPSTGCWDGYFCEYLLKENKLLLQNLFINLGAGMLSVEMPQIGPEINGVKPAVGTLKNLSFNNYYANLNLPISYTGGLLIATGFIRKLYVHMGYHPAWKYEIVKELLLKAGSVIEIRDVSEPMRKKRSEMKKQSLDPEHLANNEEFEKWVEGCFNLDYAL